MSRDNISSGRFDPNLGDILQDVKRVDVFLDVVFEFLHRRTDFYRTMEKEDDIMGLPAGVAKKLVMQAYMKYDRLTHGQPEATPKKTEPCPSQTSGDNPPFAEEVVEVETESGVEEKQAAGPKEPPFTKETNTTTGKLKEARKPKRTLTAADTYNGASHESYCWSQTLSDVDLKVFVPEDLKRGKDLKVEIRNKSLKVLTKTGDTLIDSPLVSEIHGEECMWSLHPGSYVQLTLEKKVGTWWKAVFVGEPEIDQKTIDNTLNVHDMDGESKADYDRVLYDMEQKRQGKPTIKEMETQEMLRKAWDAEGSPFAGSEFDPSKVNIST